MANSHIHEHGARFERAEQPIEIVQELPVLMEVPELGSCCRCATLKASRVICERLWRRRVRSISMRC